MKGKKTATIVKALILGLAFSLALIYFQLTQVKSGLEDYYKSMNNRLGQGAIQHGINIYISDDEDVSDSELKKREGAIALNEGPFEDGYKQMQCYTTKLVSGVNVSEIKSLSGRAAVRDVFAYYDENMESIMTTDTLLLVKRDAKESHAEVFYTYKDADLTDRMNDLLETYGSVEIGKVVFCMEGAYIRGDSFIPEKLTYYSIGQGGSKSETETIETKVRDREAMEADGFKYYDLKDEFRIGDISDAGDYVTYCYAIPDKTRAIIENKMNTAISNGEIDTTIYGKQRLFTVEYFRVSEVEIPKLRKNVYAVSYKYDNVLYEIAIHGFAGGRGLLYLELFFLEFAIIMLLSVPIALVINKVRFKNE